MTNNEVKMVCKAQGELRSIYLRCIKESWTADRLHKEALDVTRGLEDASERVYWCVDGYREGLLTAIYQTHVELESDRVYRWPNGEFFTRGY